MLKTTGKMNTIFEVTVEANVFYAILITCFLSCSVIPSSAETTWAKWKPYFTRAAGRSVILILATAHFLD